MMGYNDVEVVVPHDKNLVDAHGNNGGGGGNGGSVDYVSLAVGDNTITNRATTTTTVGGGDASSSSSSALLAETSGCATTMRRSKVADNEDADADADARCRRQEQQVLFEDEYHPHHGSDSNSSSSSNNNNESSSSLCFWPPCCYYWNRKSTSSSSSSSYWNNDNCTVSRLFCCLVVPLNMSSSSSSSRSSIPVPSSRQTSNTTTNSDDDDGGASGAGAGTRWCGGCSNIDWKSIRVQVQLFFQMAIPYYQESPTGRCMLIILIILTFMNAALSALFSFLNKDFWNALSDRNVHDFQVVLLKYVVALVCGAPFIALYKFQQEQLAVHWREWMTCRTLQLYTQNRMYYKLERGCCDTNNNNNSKNSHDDDDGKKNTENHHNNNTMMMMIDNPDQRISQDIESFTSFSLSLLVTILISILDLVVFSIILWMIYPTLFIAIVAYAIFGTIITTALGHVLIRLNFRQLQKEANLRYALVRWRDNAESIAFYKGEALEGQTVHERVGHVMTNRRAINVAVRNMEFFTNSYQFLVQILPIMVVSKQYFAGEISLGIISQSVGAFAHILSDMSIIVTQFEQLSTFCAGIERLSTFFQAMQRARGSNKNAATGNDDDHDDGSFDTCSLLHVSNDSCLDNKHHGIWYDNATSSHKANNAAAAASTTPQHTSSSSSSSRLPPPLPHYGSTEDTGKTNDAPIMQSLSCSMPKSDATKPSTTAASLDTPFVPMGDTHNNHAGATTWNGTYGTIVLQTHDNMRGDNNKYHQATMPSVSVGADTVINNNNNNNNNTTILSIHRLDLCTPDRRRLLIKNLTLQIQSGEHLLIVGNSGAGKSSLLRAISGLWTVGNGQIKRPHDDQVYFLPQRPYCTVGSLKDQLVYPSCCGHYDDSSNKMTTTTTTTTTEPSNQQNHTTTRQRQYDTVYLLSILQQVDLWSVASRVGNGDPVRGLDMVLDWTNVLSLGEQQRLAFGRLLVNRPRLAILDESTSALDMASEARMYALLQQAATTTPQEGGGLTYISVGHRPSLVQYHDKRLRLMGQDGYELTDIVPGMTS